MSQIELDIIKILVIFNKFNFIRTAPLNLEHKL
jgi:hypothetical protein